MKIVCVCTRLGSYRCLAKCGLLGASHRTKRIKTEKGAETDTRHTHTHTRADTDTHTECMRERHGTLLRDKENGKSGKSEHLFVTFV